MQANEVTGFFVLLVLNFFWNVLMGWEIIQVCAYFRGFKSSEIHTYLEEMPSLHRTFYRRLAMKARPDKDIAVTVLLMGFYVMGGLLFQAMLVYRLFQSTSAGTQTAILCLILILMPTFIFFLSTCVWVKPTPR